MYGLRTSKLAIDDRDYESCGDEEILARSPSEEDAEEKNFLSVNETIRQTAHQNIETKNESNITTPSQLPSIIETQSFHEIRLGRGTVLCHQAVGLSGRLTI